LFNVHLRKPERNWKKREKKHEKNEKKHEKNMKNPKPNIQFEQHHFEPLPNDKLSRQL